MKFLIAAWIIASPLTSYSAETLGQLLNKISLDDRGGKSKLEEKKQTSITSGGNYNLPKANINLETVRPQKTSRYANTDNSGRQELEAKTDEQIEELFKLTKKFQNSANRGELWLRLAELYVEKAELVDFRVYDKYEQALKDFEAGRSKVKPSLNLEEARDYNRKAVQLYEWFQRDFPKDKKMDQVLFFLGYNYYELNRLTDGTKAYSELTENYPRSPFIVESNFALGEFYFENEKWDKAYPYYLRVTLDKRSRLYAFGLYKTAWCLFRIGKHQNALSLMEKLIRFAQEERKSTASKFRIDSEALRDVVVFYGEGGEVKKAEEFFNSLAGEKAAIYLEQLAYYYSQKGYRERAKYMFERLVDKNPTSAKAYDYYYQLVTLYSSVSKFAEFKNVLYRWVRDFGKNSEWYNVNQSNVTLIENSEKLRENTLRNYVLQEHQTAQNSRATFSQKNALEGYKLYFENFEGAALSGDMHFYYAELLYDMDKFAEAGDQYRIVVEKYPQSKYQEKAAINIVLSYEKALPTDEFLRKRAGNRTEQIEMSKEVSNFIEATNWYIQKVPNGERTVEIMFRQGRLYYLHNYFDEATQIFKTIVQKYPKSKYAEYSANLLLDIFNLKKDYIGLEKTGSELLGIESIANSKAGGEIKGVLEKASFKKAQDSEVNKDYKTSAEQFWSFAKQNPQSELVVMAYYNAGINFERAGMLVPSTQAYNMVLKSKGEKAEKLKPTARKLVAKVYQDLGFFEESADTYYYAAKEAGKDPISGNLYYNAGILYAATGQTSKALEAYEFYMGTSHQADRHEALKAQAQILERRKEYSRANEKLKSYISKTTNKKKQMEALHEIRQNLLKGDNEGELARVNAQIETLYPRLSGSDRKETAYVIADVKLDELREDLSNLRKINIPQDQKAQEKAVKEKIALITSIAKKSNAVIGYDSADEVIVALTIIGHSNAHMYEAILGTPGPKGMNEEQKALYKQGVEGAAAKFKDSAIASYKKAIEKARILESYPEAYEESIQSMKKLGANVVADSGEKIILNNYVNWMGL